MSKASQRKLAEQQKRVEKARKANPMLARLHDLRFDDMYMNPARYWTKVLTIYERPAAHPSHTLLEGALERAKEFLGAFHEVATYSTQFDGFDEGPPDVIPGMVLTVEQEGISTVQPKSPHFHTADLDVDWPRHLADQCSSQRLKGEPECVWLWAFSIPAPGCPLFVLGATKDGPGLLWCLVGNKWITATDTTALNIALDGLRLKNFTHAHTIAAGALAHGLAAGTIAPGSQMADIPGTANAVSTLVTEFAQPYLDLAVSMAFIGLDRDDDMDLTVNDAQEENDRVRAEAKAALQEAQRMLAAERLTSAGLRRDLAIKNKAIEVTQQDPSALPSRPALSVAQRMGPFFGQ